MIVTLALLMSAQPALADKYVFMGTGTIGPVSFGGGVYTPIDQYWLQRFHDTTLHSCGSGSYANDWSSEYNEDYNGTIAQDRVWPHALWYSDSLDMMFAALIYSNKMTYASLYAVPNPGSGTSVSGAIGSVGIYDSPTTLTSGSSPDREIFGTSSELDMPHSITVDDVDDLLYVANTQNGSDNGSVLVWENASTVDGNVAPDFELAASMDHPVDVHYDSTTDTLSVVNFDPGAQPEVWIYEDVSSELLSSGSSTPNIRFTFADVTSSDFIHETWYWGTEDQLYFTTRERYLHRFDTSIYHGYPATGCNALSSASCPTDPNGTNQCHWTIGVLFSYLSCANFETDAQVDLTNGAGGLGGYGMQVEESSNVIWAVVTDTDTIGDERLLRYTNASTITSAATPNKTICWDESDNSGDFYITQALWVVTD